LRSIQVLSLDGPRSVREVEIDDLVAQPDQVLIEVHAAGVTFPEVLLTRGTYQVKPALPFGLGSEISGVVLAAPETAPLHVGDRVVALTWMAGFADLALVDPTMVFPLPDAVSFVGGAALPINYLTAHFALARRGKISEGETVLVHGAAGGVGTAAIQYARARGASVIAVVSSEAKGKVAATAGANHVVLSSDFLAAVRDLTEGRGVDIVVDPVGGDRFTDSLRSLAAEGRLLVVGFTGGEIPMVRVNRLLLNNTSVLGVGWGAYAFPRPGYVQGQWSELESWFADGRLGAPAVREYPLARAGEALALLEERQATGKVVLNLR
jgi:NADPH2:quinone reductase